MATGHTAGGDADGRARADRDLDEGRVTRLSTGGKTEAQVATANFPSAATKGPFQRYGVDYAINPGDLEFLHGGDGKIHIDYDALIYVYDGNGDLVNWVGRTHPIAGTAEQVYQATMQGLLAHEEVSVPAKGVYFLRIAVHDRNRDHYGVVEVSTSQIRDAVVAGSEATPTAMPTGTLPSGRAN